MRAWYEGAGGCALSHGFCSSGAAQALPSSLSHQSQSDFFVQAVAQRATAAVTHKHTHMWATTHPGPGVHGSGASQPQAHGKKRAQDVPLDKHIHAKRMELRAEREEAPALRQRAHDLRTATATMTARYQVRASKDLVRQAASLDAEADARQSCARETEFERKVAPYIQAYSQRVELPSRFSDAPGNITAPGAIGKKRETIDSYVEQQDATVSRQTSVLGEYLCDAEHATPRLATQTRDTCPLCERALRLVPARAIMTCSSCGYSVAYLDATMSSMSYSDDVEFSTFSYRRINHFNEWLQQVQGKENFEVGAEAMQLIMRELFKQRVQRPEDITQKRVREVLKVLKMRRAYEHVALITSKLTGRHPLRLSAEAEEMCRLMFIAVQPAFEKHCPKDRKNFLSYSYCLCAAPPTTRAPCAHRMSPRIVPRIVPRMQVQVLPAPRLRPVSRHVFPPQGARQAPAAG